MNKKIKHIKTHFSFYNPNNMPLPDIWRNGLVLAEGQLSNVQDAAERNGMPWGLLSLSSELREVVYDASELYLLEGGKEYQQLSLAHLHSSFDVEYFYAKNQIIPNTAPIDFSYEYLSGVLPVPEKPEYGSMDWVDLICDAITLREQAAVDFLLTYDNKVLGNSGDKRVDFLPFTVDYMKSMITADGNEDRYFEQYIKVHAPEQISARQKTIFKPWYYLAKQDEEGFEKAIIEASQGHKKMVRGSYPISASQAMLPSILLGAVSLAYDKYAWTLKHKNDYIPEWLVYRQYE
ncbi:immunity 49 family protein [Glaciecola sp. MH2013]|uniref:immunity 49 family protein n=1 Tax=Glaciecola sp. MH2013 TaxID=2785524 RepID=UPI00189EF8CD|nr:immunity 49 family protein [Glaciecola sp. MH2013]MBF7073433.1 immunity 49 family protein [Glaciecola sp. MH2013]